MYISDCGPPSYTPGNIELNLVSNNTVYNSVTVFTCDTGYVISDVYTVTMVMQCSDNGTWFGTVDSAACVYVGEAAL